MAQNKNTARQASRRAATELGSGVRTLADNIDSRRLMMMTAAVVSAAGGLAAARSSSHPTAHSAAASRSARSGYAAGLSVESLMLRRSAAMRMTAALLVITGLRMAAALLEAGSVMAGSRA